MSWMRRRRAEPDVGGVDVAALVARCRSGDALAWEALVRRFQKRVFSLAFHYVRDPEEARDLAQEIFVRVYESLDRCREDEAFVPWMLTVARNCSIDRVRRLRVRRQATDRFQPERHDRSVDQADPQQRMEAGDRHQLVYHALDTLSENSREMILLKDIQGLKMAEIAHLLSIPLGTVKSRSGRARVELAKAILAIEPSFGGRS